MLRWAGDQRSSLERARPGVGSWRATQENVCGGESMGKRQPPLRRCQLCNARRSGLLRPDSTWNRRAELPGPKFDLPAYRHAAALARSTLLRKPQVLQNFLTHSSWDYRPVMDRVARNADSLVGGEIGTGLYIDESAFAKKGDQSVA